MISLIQNEFEIEVRILIIHITLIIDNFIGTLKFFDTLKISNNYM